jgi:ABC-type multidrug transport system ATPase subunit
VSFFFNIQGFLNVKGGMKRRLSVAIAFVGNPQIVLLDEPTTGLDPENRRQLWDILVGNIRKFVSGLNSPSESRRNRAMVLTTHSMEEADVLCTRIGTIES